MRVNDDGRTVAAMDVLGAGIGKINFTRELPPCTSRAPPGLSWGAVSAYRGPRPHDLGVSQFTLTFQQTM
jgi:hypothetical protein